MTAPATTNPLTPMERQSLTIWGETISAQIREHALILHVRNDAPLSTEEDSNPVIVPPGDVAKLRALLDEAATR